MKKTDIIAAASEELGVSSGEFGLWYEVLIHDALQSIKSSKLLEIKETEIQIEDGAGLLPEDTVDCLKVYDEHCKRICPQCKWHIENRYIVFCKDMRKHFPDGSYIKIKYKGIKTDENGELVIDESWGRMLIAYLGWKTCRRFFEKYPDRILQDYRREFVNQKLICNY